MRPGESGLDLFPAGLLHHWRALLQTGDHDYVRCNGIHAVPFRVLSTGENPQDSTLFLPSVPFPQRWKVRKIAVVLLRDVRAFVSFGQVSAKEFLNFPNPHQVDFRACCFKTKKLISTGYTCSVCLSTFGEIVPQYVQSPASYPSPVVTHLLRICRLCPDVPPVRLFSR